MGGATMGLPPKGVRMVMEVHPVLVRSLLLQDLAIVVEDVVKAYVATSRIDLIVHMVDAKPVVDPATAG